MLKPTILTLGVLAATGCVTRAQHDALAKELDGTRQELVDTRSQLDKERGYLDASHDEAVDYQQGRNALERRNERLEQDFEFVRLQRDASAAELAAVLADKTKLESSVEKMRRALAEQAAREMQAAARIAEYQALLARFKKLIDAGKLRVKIVDGRMVLQLPSDILFASGSAKVSDEGKEALQQVGEVLATLSDRHFQVEGHTDTVPINTERFPSNWELGAARALRVTNTLVAAGVRSEQLSAASYGQWHPVASNETDEGKQLNRRIEIALVPDLSTLPGAADLERIGG
jgi:chemotaxis protein MotB